MALSPAPIKDDIADIQLKEKFAHIWVRWFNEIYRKLNSDVSEDITIVTAIQAGGAGGVGFQYKTRVLTVTDGVITTAGDASSWNDI